MEDKRRRARVQGAWAGPAKSQAVAQPGKNLWGIHVHVDSYHPLLFYPLGLKRTPISINVKELTENVAATSSDVVDCDLRVELYFSSYLVTTLKPFSVC